MAIIISDTSPIRAFANLGLVDVLGKLFEILRRKYDFFISDALVHQTLRVVGEEPEQGKQYVTSDQVRKDCHAHRNHYASALGHDD